MSELSPRARALIEAARPAEAPLGADRLRVRAALEAQLAAAAVADPTSTSAGTGAGALGATTKALLAAAAIAGAGGLATWLAPLRSTPEPPAAAAALQPKAPAPASEAPDQPPPAEPAPVEPSPALAAAPRSKRTAAPPPARSEPEPVAEEAPVVAPAPPACSPSAELALLQAVQLELNAHRPLRVLELLDDGAASCPGGALMEERQAAQILALCELGLLAQAEDRLSQFRERYRRSPHMHRLLAACGQR